MQDPVLDRQLRDCKELAEAWRVFQDLFNAAIRGGDEITPNREQLFLEVKSKIAMLHDSFMDALKHDQQIGQNVFSICARCITMRHVGKMSQAETKKIEIEWHECYLLLNETVSTLDEEIGRLAAINATRYHMKRFFKRVGANILAFLKSRGLKYTLFMVGVIFIIWGVPAFGIYDYDNFRKVNGLNKVYNFWLNVKRTTVDKTAPYGALDDFMTLFLPSLGAPPGTTYGESKITRQDAMNKYGHGNTSDGKSLKELLSTVTDDQFKSLTLKKIGSFSDNTEVIIFCFYANRDAFKVAEAMKTRYSRESPEAHAFNKNNILVILVGKDLQMRKDIATGTFQQSAF